MGLEARIWAWRLEFGPRDWDLGLETGIWALILGFEGGTEEEKKEEEEEKIPHMCESIGHRPLWGRCPKRGRRQLILFQILPNCSQVNDSFREEKSETHVITMQSKHR